ncbi:hypothetical protein [Singulisphaera sp. PoT]|uniref:hypothetical protein n=1 Tax=Singulisphaera sp. PoT TaxID=3411797 RepID=UPI003BF5DD7E
MVADYYAMLNVDPSSGREALEAALARCQPAWSSGTRNPKNKHTFQSYLDQIPAIRQALLGTSEARAAYDAELAAVRRVERDRKLDALQRLLRLRAAKGGLTVADRTLLREQAVKLGLTHEDLDRLAESIPPKVELAGEEDRPDPPVDVLDPAMRRQISVALEHLRRRNLYDVLGLERDAPTAEIVTRADAERRRWMQKAQVTAEKTAWLELISHAQSHLTNPAARARYDRTLVIEAEENLGESITFALKGVLQLDPGTRSALVDEAATLGIAPDRAERLILRACRAQGVARDTGASFASLAKAARLLRCRACSGVTDFSEVARQPRPECRHCHEPLRWDCPVCQKTRWVDEPKCVCGFRLEWKEPLHHHFEAARLAFRERQVEISKLHLQRILEFAPTHASTLKALEKLSERQEQIERARAAWESARAAGQWFAARKAADAWSILVPVDHPGARAARDKADQVVRQAKALAARAKAIAQADPKAARELYRQSLGLASDLPEAISGLLRCPPEHPTNLTADYERGRVRLRWVAPNPDGHGSFSYVIVRKSGAPIINLADGTRIAEVQATEYEDLDVVAGESVSYAILTRRGASESIAATAIGPVLLLGEVVDVRVEEGDREVTLSWSLPERASGVRVMRKLGSPPSNPQDGERVETLRDRVQDRNLINDRVYHYGLFAAYKTADGPMLAARGVFVSAQPHPPTEILEAPTIAQEADGRIRLDWIEPARGRVRFLRTLAPLSRGPGSRLTLAEADLLGGIWIDPISSNRAYDPEPLAFGVCHYTPLLSAAGMLTVGHASTFSCVRDPSELRANRVAGGKILLRWRWSAQGHECWVIAKAGSLPTGPNDPDAIRTTVHEVEYSRVGHHALLLPTGRDGPWHIQVFTVAKIGDEVVVSPGLEPSARIVVTGPHPEITISYDLRKPSFPGRAWSLTFRTEPAGSEVPPTALVAHPRTVPLSVDDGEIVAQFPAARDGTTFSIPNKLNLAKGRARVFADPHADPDSLPPIRLRHPETGVARV